VLQRLSKKDITDKNVEVQICHLRRELRSTGLSIRTDWARGYALDYAQNCPGASVSDMPTTKHTKRRVFWRGIWIGPSIHKIAEVLETKGFTLRRKLRDIGEYSSESSVSNALRYLADISTITGLELVSKSTPLGTAHSLIPAGDDV